MAIITLIEKILVDCAIPPSRYQYFDRTTTDTYLTLLSQFDFTVHDLCSYVGYKQCQDAIREIFINNGHDGLTIFLNVNNDFTPADLVINDDNKLLHIKFNFVLKNQPIKSFSSLTLDEIKW